MIPPMPMGYGRGRENFKIKTGNTFDPLSAAESAMDHSMNMMLNAQRLARINEFSARGKQSMTIKSMFDQINQAVSNHSANGIGKQLSLLREKVFVKHLIKIAADSNAADEVRAQSFAYLNGIKSRLGSKSMGSSTYAHSNYLSQMIGQFLDDPSAFELPPVLPMPDGSPIGCGVEW